MTRSVLPASRIDSVQGFPDLNIAPQHLITCLFLFCLLLLLLLLLLLEVGRGGVLHFDLKLKICFTYSRTFLWGTFTLVGMDSGTKLSLTYRKRISLRYAPSFHACSGAVFCCFCCCCFCCCCFCLFVFLCRSSAQTVHPCWGLDTGHWLLTPCQPWRLYQGETHLIRIKQHICTYMWKLVPRDVSHGETFYQNTKKNTQNNNINTC